MEENICKFANHVSDVKIALDDTKNTYNLRIKKTIHI